MLEYNPYNSGVMPLMNVQNVVAYNSRKRGGKKYGRVSFKAMHDQRVTMDIPRLLPSSERPSASGSRALIVTL